VWARRLKETFAILTVGDGMIEVIFPTEHSLLWEFGPARVRKVARFFAENPNLMRLLGAGCLRHLADAAPIPRTIANFREPAVAVARR
jgi:hypothetical protein